MDIREFLAHLEGGANRCEWPWELAQAMLAAQTSHPSHEDGTRISTTVLTSKCKRRLVFERQTEYEVDPADLYAMFRGTMFHGQLEAWAHWQAYAEARFYIKDLGKLIPEVARALPRKDRSLSGSPDLVRPNVGILYDYKRTKEVPRFDRVWPDHAAQNNINRWLVDHAETVAIRESDEWWQPVADTDYDWDQVEGLVEANPGTRKVTWDLSVPSVRERFVPVDWTELVIVYVDDKGPKPLSVTRSERVPAKQGGFKNARVPDIWTDEVVEAYIAREYVAARTALLAGVAPIPGGWEYQSHALCVRCPFRRECAALEREGL